QQLQKLLDWLKPVPVDARLETILQFRQPGTCQWVLDSPMFVAWKESTSGSFLWLNGISGSGKTVISSVVIDHLMQTLAPDDVVIYAFCEFRNQQSIIPGTILRTLFSELLRAYPGAITPHFSDLVDAEGKRRSPPQTVSRIGLLIRRAAQGFNRVYLVLDGLDECDRRDRQELLKMLPTLASDDGFKVFVASRPEVDIREAFPLGDTSFLQMETGDAHVHGDIRLHINRELERRRELVRLPPKLKDEIRATLGASGMFRLVECQLDVLVEKPTPHSLRRALQNLPDGLTGVYDRILTRIPEDTEVIARRALRWLADVKQPIRLVQLAEAVMIECSSSELNTDYWVSSSDVILEALSSLVMHNLNEDVISLSHMSVLEYLMSANLLETPFKHYYFPPLPVLANEMVALLFDYMLIDDFNRPKFEVEDELHQFVDEQHPFYYYAATFWIDYIPSIDISRPATLKSLLRFIESANGCHELGHQILCIHAGQFYKPEYLNHPLRFLCWHGIQPSLVLHFSSLKLPHDLIQCCLFASIWKGPTELVENFLDFAGADVHCEHICPYEPADGRMQSSAPRNPLVYAFDAGNLPAARSLLQRGAIVDHVLGDGWTTLHSATASGLLEAVQMILDDPSHEVDVHARNWSGLTAYRIAVQMDTKEIIRYLEDHGASEKLDLSVEPLEIMDEREVIQVGLCLAQMLRTEFKLVPVILDLAEYWAVSSTRRSTPQGTIYTQDSPEEPYITLKITGGSKAPLRRLVFTTKSRDQGWSDHTGNIGTYRESCSWFEAGNGSLQTLSRRRIQNNLHGSSKLRDHRNVWVHDGPTAISDWMHTFRSGDVVEVYPRAMYKGWVNHVYAIEVVAYTCCL
ncbi:hypothetical protein B0H14DRAFT_3732865, partial [Mycena olivaceomarginata]